jgi:tetratricopeptide (TPR) repeat protein
VFLSWLLVVASLVSVFTHGTPLSAAFFGNSLEIDSLGSIVLSVSVLTIAALTLRTQRGFSLMGKVGGAFLLFLVISQIAIFFLSLSGVSIGVPTLLGSVSDFAVVLGGGVVVVSLLLSLGVLSNRIKVVAIVFLVLALLFIAASNNTLVWILLGIASLAMALQSLVGLRSKGWKGDDEDSEGVIAILGKDGGSVSHEGNEQKGDMPGLLLPALVFILSVVFVLGSATIGPSMGQAFRLSETQVKPSWSASFDVARGAFGQNPLFGAGPTNFSLAWHNFKPQGVVDSVFWASDFSLSVGALPTYLITTGALGVIALILFIAGFLWFGIQALVRSRQRSMAIFSLATFALSLYLLVSIFIGTTSTPVFIFAFLAVGLFVASTRFGAQGRREWGIFFSRSPRFGFVIVFLLTILLVATIGSGYLLAERYLGETAFSSAVAKFQGGDIAGAQTELARAASFVADDEFYRVAAVAGISAMNTIANDTSLSQETARARFQETLTQSINAGLLATQINPGNYQNWVALGSVYQAVVPLQIPESYESAVEAYDRASALYPRNPGLEFTRAQLELAHGSADSAIEHLNAALSIKQNYTEAIFLKSQIEVQTGKIAEAQASAEAALFFEPDNQTVLYQVALLRAGRGDLAGAKVALSRALEVNGAFANARYVLAVVLAQEGDLNGAKDELQKIADLSPENSAQVEASIASLADGKNPFPPNVLSLSGPLPQEGSGTTEE